MQIYRIRCDSQIVGCIVALNKAVALAYAVGRYGAGADAEKVSAKNAVSTLGICILIETKEIYTNDLSSGKKVRVIGQVQT